MNKYKVKVTHLFAEIVDIEAENPEDAKKQVEKLIQQEDFQSQPQYETTIPSEHWASITEEEFQKLVKSFSEEIGKEQESSNIIVP